MTTERSTYTYKDGAEETVTLRRSPIAPRGHALLQVSCSDGRRTDCYVNTAWLRDRLNDLDPHPLTPDAITDEMVERAQHKIQLRATRIPAETIRLALIAALTEPPARPEGAENIERVILDYKRENAHRGYSDAEIADRIAEEMNR